ncbi:MAG: RNA polymerase factor sigma-54 [Bacteroidetes bacterium]|nr:RNA polymerase factor sigma-54 [Bacteroidota bacterium]
MAIHQRLQQKLLQRLSPQQIQLMKLLQVPTASLETRIKEELEENPALELEPERFEEKENADEDFDSIDENTDETGTDSFEEDTGSDYIQDDDDEADYKLRDTNYPEFSEEREHPIRSGTSFYDLLTDQLQLLNLDTTQQIIAEQVVGSIDEDGYLRRDTSAMVDDLAFKQNVIVTEVEVEAIIEMIQQFDPPGVAARNLQECLLLQLKRKEQADPLAILAINILTNYFDEFSRKHYDKIQKAIAVTEDEMRDVIQLVTKLNPKPGGESPDDTQELNYVVPDFFIYNNGGKLELTLNSRNAPELRISEGYRDMLRDYEKGAKKDKRQKEAVLFIKQKIDAAKWFIDAIQQRQQTLLLTMQAILELQRDFLMSGDESDLHPMILKDVAAATGLDISTVSRVANSKYVQTEFGTYRLKFFFNEALTTDTGEEVSTREVKRILSDLVAGEDKKNPVSDERLTELLQEKGYEIARRTVAKYREQLMIPVARLRREL